MADREIKVELVANQTTGIGVSLGQTTQGMGVDISAGQGLTQIYHDETLQGKGTQPDPLGIAQEILDDIDSRASESDLQAETEARIAGDETLDAKIFAEQQARQAGDTALGTRIDNETTRATGAESALSDRITANANAISAETTAREQADEIFQGQLDSLSTHIDAETQNRIDADNALSERITANANDITAINNELATYGDIVTHDADEFATAAQGALADTAIQPNDNVSELTNDATYQTQAQVNTAIATHNTSTTAHNDIRTAISGKQDTLTAGDNIDITGDVISATDTTYTAGNGLTLTGTEFSANVINNTNSDSTTDALSAAAGKSLQEQVNNLLGRGKYLSIWDCTTGLAMDEPPVNPYTIETGSYFIVGKVGTTNYRPNGGVYDKDVPSTTIETGSVKVNDTYFYDGTQWRLLDTPEKEVSFSALAGSPYDNTNLASALNSKQATISDLTTIRNNASAGKSASDTIASYGDVVTHDADEFATAEQGSKADTALQPNDNISELTNDSNYQTQAQVNTAISAHNTSSTAHQDIRTELAGKADSSDIPTKTSDLTNDSGFITSSYHDATKQDVISDLSTIRSNASAGKSASDTIATYGNIVTHNTSEFATAAQGALADSALQSGDNVSELTNDSGYITKSVNNLENYTDTSTLTELLAGKQPTGDYATNTALTQGLATKQDTISDLATIRNNASAGKTASDTIATYGDIVTHDTSEFATASQGALADTALQSGDNVSELINDAGYITSAYHDNTKQDVISDLSTIRSGATAGSTAIQPDDNISELTNDANYQNGTQVTASISAHNTSTTAHSDIRSAISAKQDQLTAGTNVDITNNVISATDTKYTAGTGLTLSGTTFSANITDNVTSTSTTSALSAKQGKELATRITNLESLGRYLSEWDCTTGLAMTNPPYDNYPYRTGDYFLVLNVASAGGTNYRPSGDEYVIGQPSTTVETGSVSVGSRYIYDGTVWILQSNAQQTVSFSNIAGQPTDNSNLASALNAKANTADLATVATSGSYDDLSNKPTIPAAQVPADWNATTGVARILNKPTIPIVPTNVSAFTNDSNYQTGTQVSSAISTHNSSSSAHSDIRTALNGKQATITGGATTITSTNLTANRALVSNSSGKVDVSAVTSTELGYLDGVTSAIQTQLNGKATSSDITSAISTHNSSTTAHSDIRSAVASKSTVSVSATGTATDEVSYITIDGVQKKLAGGSSSGSSAYNVGDIFYTSRTDTTLAGAVECNGATYSTTDFSGIGAIGALLAAGKVPYISLSQYASDLAAHGSVRAFGWDGGSSTSFRVPTLSSVFIEAGQAASAGDYISAGLPNITSDFIFTGLDGSYPESGSASGAISLVVDSKSGAQLHLYDSYAPSTYFPRTYIKSAQLNANNSSSIYGNSTTVQPNSVKYRAMVQLANGATDEALETCTSVLADVANLKAHRIIEFQEPTASNNYTWYRKYADGWVEQGGHCTTDITCSMPIQMSDANYSIIVQLIERANGGSGASNMSTTSFIPRVQEYNLADWKHVQVLAYWQVSGKYAN